MLILKSLGSIRVHVEWLEIVLTPGSLAHNDSHHVPYVTSNNYDVTDKYEAWLSGYDRVYRY